MAPNSGITIIGLVPWLMILAILAAVVVLIVLFIKRRRPAQQEPSCGQCGYVVTGLPTFICPECGSDLREVGIVTTQSPRALSPLAKGIIWTIAFPLPALLLGALITALGPHQLVESRSCVVSPNSGAYTQIALDCTAKGPSSASLRTETLVLRLTTLSTPSGPSKTSELTVDPANFGYRYVGKDGQPVTASTGFDAHVILDWMEAVGIDGGNAAVQTETTELFAQANAMGAPSGGNVPMPSFNTLKNSMHGTYGSPLWWTITQLILWPLIWLLGLWRFARKKPPASPAPKC
jgi:hypothetical protein